MVVALICDPHIWKDPRETKSHTSRMIDDTEPSATAALHQDGKQPEATGQIEVA